MPPVSFHRGIFVRDYRIEILSHQRIYLGRGIIFYTVIQIPFNDMAVSTGIIAVTSPFEQSATNA